MALRKTVDRDVIVAAANRMIAHLAESGTQADQIRREAIRELAFSILHDGGSYAGYRYLNEKTLLPPDADGWRREVWDETRIALY